MIGRLTKLGLGVGVLALALAPLTLPLPLAPAAPDGGLAAREWNQTRGNSRRTGFVAVQPVASQPVDAWKLSFETINGGPVTWGGTLFIAADGDLIALDPLTGEERGRKSLRLKTDVELASWQGTVVVGDKKTLRSFTWLGDKFKSGWTKRGKWIRGLGVHNGTLLAPQEGGGIHAIAFSNGKQSKEPATGTGLAAAESVDGVTMVFSAGLGLRGQEKKDRVELVQSAIGLDRMKAPEFKVKRRSWLNPLLGKAPVTLEVSRTTLADSKGDACLIRSVTLDDARQGGNGTFVFDTDPNAGKPCQIVYAPVGHKGAFLGFNKKGDLLRTNDKGAGRPVVRADGLPKGVEAHDATSAGNVLFFGNWALDIDNKRVLWSRADLKPLGPAIPVADGMLALITTDNALIGLADPAVVSVSTSADGGSDEPDEPRRKVTLPTDADGVMLVDGRFIEGKYSTMTGDTVVTPTDGEGFKVADDDVLVAQQKGEIEYRGSEFEVFEFWRDGLEGQHVDALVEVYEGCIEAGLISEASIYLQETRKFNIENARMQELQAKLTGKRQHPNAKVRAKKWLEREAEARKESFAEALRGAEWCAKRGFPTAGTVLLQLADRIQPGSNEIIKRAAKYIPEEFPWKDETYGPKKWLEWAPEILPADARFLSADDSAWSRARNDPWRQTGTLLFRSNNLLFFSRTHDPKVVGACLRNGEGAVKTLRALLGVGDEDRVTSDRKRLDVRLHIDRESYLNEVLPNGSKPIEWSAGFYTPSENVSRFYVSQLGDPNESGRDLYKTLVHELTHHYVEMRWMPHFGSTNRGGAIQPGHWVVEGFARFVEDQTIEISRRGVLFNDPTVPSVDTCVQLLAQDRLMDTAELVDSDYTKFMALPKVPVTRVKLRATLQARNVDPRLRYYEQAGALVYFMINERGDEGRQLFISYLKQRYLGRLKKPSAKDLGFESGEELDKALRAFLKSLAK